MEQIYDMIIIGGGPAGYTAALYAARAGLSTLVLEKLSAGGQMALTEQIDNYPGRELFQHQGSTTTPALKAASTALRWAKKCSRAPSASAR